MRVMFQNHASLLFELDGHFLLTDPWYEKPAFGSWLPTYPSYVHPTYLAALKDKLSVLISHGHDDHFDDEMLTLFDHDTLFITAKFKAPSVVNRLKNLGFNNVLLVDEGEQLVSERWLVSSYIVEDYSHDDAVYLIRSDSGAVIHANDNWGVFRSDHAELINKRCDDYSRESIALFSQSNSASGYPLNYRCFSDEQKTDLLEAKIVGMLKGAADNASILGVDKVYAYAGFATPYVKDKNYHSESIFVDQKNIDRLVIKSAIDCDFVSPLPGSVLEFPSATLKAPFVAGYSGDYFREVSNRYYKNYRILNQCFSYNHSYDELLFDVELLEFFLVEFNKFVVNRVSKTDLHHNSIVGKVFKVVVELDGNQSLEWSLKFGVGIVQEAGMPNKTCFVKASVMMHVINGKALFEDLYTGYNAEWSRWPIDVYNRDIVMMIVMFSYVYKNRIFPAIKTNNAS